MLFTFQVTTCPSSRQSKYTHFIEHYKVYDEYIFKAKNRPGVCPNSLFFKF